MSQQTQHYYERPGAEASYPPPLQSTVIGAVKTQDAVDVAGSVGQKTPSSGKMFRCVIDPTCQMEFPRAEHLTRHERSHTKERPFQCHCLKFFSRLDNWQQHIKSVHKGEDKENALSKIRLKKVHEALKAKAEPRVTKKALKARTVGSFEREVQHLKLTSTLKPLPSSTFGVPAAPNSAQSFPAEFSTSSSAHLPFAYAKPQNLSVASKTGGCPTTSTLPTYPSISSLDGVYDRSAYWPNSSVPYSMTLPPFITQSAPTSFPMDVPGAYPVALENRREPLHSRLPHNLPASQAPTFNELSGPFTNSSDFHNPSAFPLGNFQPTGLSTFPPSYSPASDKGANFQPPESGIPCLDGLGAYLSPPLVEAPSYGFTPSHDIFSSSFTPY